MKLNKRFFCGALFVCIAVLPLFMLSNAALAAPATLVCSGNSGTLTIDLNDAKGTVAVSYPAMPVYPGSNQTAPARTTGPFPAAFDPKTITWDEATEDDRKADASIRRPASLDRMTGALQEQVCNKTNCSGIYASNCHKGEQQF
jgi:hypothetical protein